jgi:hypothetical protein
MTPPCDDERPTEHRENSPVPDTPDGKRETGLLPEPLHRLAVRGYQRAFARPERQGYPRFARRSAALASLGGCAALTPASLRLEKLLRTAPPSSLHQAQSEPQIDPRLATMTARHGGAPKRHSRRSAVRDRAFGLEWIRCTGAIGSSSHRRLCARAQRHRGPDSPRTTVAASRP